MTNQLDLQETEELVVPVFGYELLRDALLTDILGKEASSILYWAGKSLARKFPCGNIEDLFSFFHEAGWGNLILLKETKREKTFELSGPFVERRFSVQSEPSFSLESGFLAEQIALQQQIDAESVIDIQKRSKKIVFTVKWE
ncbi:YslB family protein [Bacillus sp. B190/17]|uniref:YslB family protein n=1 Tax=Bacillus lumedeiriae TaxID=3058829 RepID=A0ABW8I4Z1_9BACI